MKTRGVLHRSPFMSRLPLGLALALSFATLFALTVVGLPQQQAHAARYRLPLGGCGNCYITAYYDHGRTGGCKDYTCQSRCYGGHNGTDYGVGSWAGMDAGRDVVAAASGVVAAVHDGEYDRCTAGQCSGAGNYVILTHADGKRTYYFHLKRWSVSVSRNQQVSCGQKLGQVGSSGNSTGPHLHFEVRLSNASTRRDPFYGDCNGYSYWVTQGPYRGLSGTTCDSSSCDCTPGQTGSRACGNCGTQTRTCGSNCTWGAYGTCQGEGVCAAGSTQSQACGDCGTRTRTCTSSCTWGSYGACQSEGVCTPGQTGSRTCGNCGTQSRICASTCTWGAYGTCQGEGVCAAGTAQTQDCGDCGSQSRTCSQGCDWPGWSNCGGPDPEDGTLGCDTGEMGACSEGRERCTGGWLTCARVVEPSSEVCDGLDNSCNGLVDDGYPTQLGNPPPQYAAILDDASFPHNLDGGQRAEVWAQFVNAGTEPWQAGQVWLVALGSGEEETASALSAPDHWKAWDVPAVLTVDVPPGEVGRFEFPIVAPPLSGGLVTERFILADPEGNLIACPSPVFAVELMILPQGPHSEIGQAKSPDYSGEQPVLPISETPLDQSLVLRGHHSCATIAQGLGSFGHPFLLSTLLLGLFFRLRRKNP